MIIKEVGNQALEVKDKLEWRFVAESSDGSGEVLGRIIYGAFEDQPEAMNIFRFMVTEGIEDRESVGVRFLTETMGQLQEKGLSFKSVEFHLYSVKGNDFAEYGAIFSAAGFQITQEKKSLEAPSTHGSLGTQVQSGPVRLSYRTLEEVGEGKFVDAIAQVTAGTLDRDDLALVAAHGPIKAAQDYYGLLKEMDFDEKWWRLAYDDQGELVGLVVPQRYDEDCGVINYIGVVPEQRGKGYVNDLIRGACAVILEGGFESVIADIDKENLPLEKALLRHGFCETRELAILKYVV